MERESFTSIPIAKLLNDSFVSIKVDKEERSDVDRVYMTYVQVAHNMILSHCKLFKPASSIKVGTIHATCILQASWHGPLYKLLCTLTAFQQYQL